MHNKTWNVLLGYWKLYLEFLIFTKLHVFSCIYPTITSMFAGHLVHYLTSSFHVTERSKIIWHKKKVCNFYLNAAISHFFYTLLVFFFVSYETHHTMFNFTWKFKIPTLILHTPLNSFGYVLKCLADRAKMWPILWPVLPALQH